MANKISATKQEKPVFDPQKNYVWEPDDIFEFTGLEFDALYKTLRDLALTAQGASPHAILTVFNTVHQIFVSGVEGGLIKEAPKAEQEPAREGSAPVDLTKELEQAKEEALAGAVVPEQPSKGRKPKK